MRGTIDKPRGLELKGCRNLIGRSIQLLISLSGGENPVLIVVS